MKGLQHTGAFVVQFNAETDLASGRVSGRVEHVASSEATRFASLDELLAFVERVLGAVRLQESGAADRAPIFILHSETQE